MKKVMSLSLVLILALSMLSACSSGEKSVSGASEISAETVNTEGTTFVTDDYGRSVQVPQDITRIAPSGGTATMFLMTIAPDMLVGLAASPSTVQMKYFPEETWTLPTFGQFYGSKTTLNKEALIAAKPQVIIDVGDRKISGRSDMEGIQSTTGIPTLFFEADLEHMADAYRKIGKVLGREEEAEALASFVEKTVNMANEKSALINDEERLTVLYGTGPTGLAVNAEESSQAQVIDLIGADNAIIPDVITDAGGGTTVNLEGVYVADPDVLIFQSGGPYDKLETTGWAELRAVKNGDYYEIPGQPYCWMSSPPSVNMVLGVYWLGQLIYPEIYNDYDIVKTAQEYYKLFWHYDLTDEEAAEFLANSYFKD